LREQDRAGRGAAGDVAAGEGVGEPLAGGEHRVAAAPEGGTRDDARGVVAVGATEAAGGHRRRTVGRGHDLEGHEPGEGGDGDDGQPATWAETTHGTTSPGQTGRTREVV